MYTDKFLSVSADQTLTSGQTVIVSTDTVDLAVARDIGEGHDVYAVASITEEPVNQSTTAVTGFTATDVGNIVAKNAHGLVNGLAIKFATLSQACGLDVGVTYYVVTAQANDFQVALAPGGTPIDITANATATLYFAPGNMYIQAITATNAALTTGVQVVAQSDAVEGFAIKDTIGQKQGYTFTVKLSPLVSGNTDATASQGNLGARYLGLRYVAGAGTFTGHKVTGLFTTDMQDGRKAYTSGFTVV